MRNLTSHTYDEAQAIQVYQFLKKDGVFLFEATAVKMRKWIT
ncbi:hypothetical protein [Pseudoduganella sp. UC29_71]|jgi:hypothetical protein